MSARRVAIVGGCVAVVASSVVAAVVLSSTQPDPPSTAASGNVQQFTGSPGEFDSTGKPLFDARSVLEETARKQGSDEATRLLSEWSSTSALYARTCHNDAHMLGALAARLQPPEDVVQYATDECDFGFIHGVLKATALDSPPDVDLTQLERLCKQAPEEILENCEHGLGHAIPLRDSLSLSESFAMCSQLQTDSSVAQCVTGVSMEFGVNSMVFHDLRSLDPGSLNADGTLTELVISPAEQIDPCAALRGGSFDGLDVCYRHVHYFWSSELGEEYQTFADRCSLYADDANGSCYQSLGAWVWYEEEPDATTDISVHKALLDRGCMQLTSTRAAQGCITGYMHVIWQSEFRVLPSLCEQLGRAYEPGCSTSEDKFRVVG